MADTTHPYLSRLATHPLPPCRHDDVAQVITVTHAIRQHQHSTGCAPSLPTSIYQPGKLTPSATHYMAWQG